MNHISQTVNELLRTLHERQAQAEALPEMTISLIQSCIDEGTELEPAAKKNIEKMVFQKGFPEDQKEIILNLLNKI